MNASGLTSLAVGVVNPQKSELALWLLWQHITHKIIGSFLQSNLSQSYCLSGSFLQLFEYKLQISPTLSLVRLNSLYFALKLDLLTGIFYLIVCCLGCFDNILIDFVRCF